MTLEGLTIPGRAGKRSKVAVEDIRMALPEDSVEETIQLSLDKLDETIHDEISKSSKTVNGKYMFQDCKQLIV